MKLLLRLDDFSPNRQAAPWSAIEGILDRHGIKPLVAVIPNDNHFGSKESNDEFWQHLKILQEKGWSIALHGETHQLSPISGGTPQEVFFASKSEFVGLPCEAQLEKLNRALDGLVRHGVKPVAFVAPNHGFDSNTVKALRQQGMIPYISDGISFRIFRDRGLVWLPQLDWKIPRLPIGFRTVCLHPSTMKDNEIANFEAALRRNAPNFVCLDDINAEWAPAKGLSDRLFAVFFRLFYTCKLALYQLRRFIQREEAK